MKLTDNSSLGTMGLTGIVVTAGVIWGQLSPWWLTLGVLLIVAGIGSESGRSRDWDRDWD